jgi:hypothetical protein
MAAALLAAAAPASAIPIDPGGSPCASTSTASLSVSPSSTTPDRPTTTVTWSISPGRGCTPTVVRLLFRDKTTGVVTDTGVRGAGGSVALIPQTSGTYSLQAVINGWIAEFGAEPVTVGLPVVNGRPTVEITQPGQNALFAQAVGVPNAVVRVAGYLDLDLSYMAHIHVAPGVEIIGERASYPKGPRLFTRTYPRSLLDIGSRDEPSDNVRITGIRFDGGESSDPCDSAGVEDADAISVLSSQNVRIDHNELYRWRGAGVTVYDPAQDRTANPPQPGRINKENAGTVRVDDNFIHDNQHPGYCGPNPFGSGHGGGYGVSVNQGGFALIERNVFDQNRHAITGHGSDGDGYLLERNLFLRPGVDSVKVWITNYNHQIDMHGLNTCGSGEHWNCGPAGEYMEVAWNTVVFPTSDAIQLRGTPTDKRGMSVYGNVFAQRRDSALTQTETGLHDNGGNLFGISNPQTLAFLFPPDSAGTCDFDGDAVNDTFWATGATWWYHSSLVGHDVYLNLSSHGTLGAHSLTDVDGDGRCDVTTDQGTFRTPSDAPFDLVRPADQASMAGHPVDLQLSEVGPGTLTWVAGGLPSGLTLNAGTGRITGVPGGPGAYTVRLGASDAHGDTAYRTFHWTVTPDLRQVPEIFDLTRPQAKAALVSIGLRLGAETVECGRMGRVLSQSPDPGTMVPSGTGVNYTIGGRPSDGRQCN